MDEFTTQLIESLKKTFTASDPMLTLLIWGIYAGLTVGVILALINRVNTHKVLSAVIKAKAVDKSSAKTIEELGLGGSYFSKKALRPSSPMLKYIKAYREQTGQKPKNKYDGVRFYLPEDNRISAEVRFSEERHPVITFIIAAVVLFAIALLAIRFVPQFIEAYSKIGGK